MKEQQVGTLPKTLGDLKESGYEARPIKEELRDNLIEKLKDGEEVFQGILGYEDTVIPDVQRAILARHNIRRRPVSRERWSSYWTNTSRSSKAGI
jgi:hypothetical protein